MWWYYGTACMAWYPLVYPIFVSLNVTTCRSRDVQRSRTEDGVTPDNQVLISLTSTGQKDEIPQNDISCLPLPLCLSQTLIENSRYFPAALLFIFLKCHLKTFVKILWSLTLEITRYEESGSHASKVKMLKIKVIFVTESVISYIPGMFDLYLCGNIASNIMEIVY